MDTTETKFKWSYVFDQPTRILVVDDDPLLREFASVYLATPLASVDTVADGKAALDLLRNARFDVVLVDIEMPEIDGFELVRRVRAQESLRNLPIVMLTGREDIASIDRAYDLGATSFVTKPVNWRELAYQLRYVIRTGRTEARGLLTHDLATGLNAMIASAELIGANADASCAAHARKIAALGKDLLRKLAAHRDDAASEQSADVLLPRNAA
jgi:DNA-binding response OmpR family regulator